TPPDTGPHEDARPDLCSGSRAPGREFALGLHGRTADAPSRNSACARAEPVPGWDGACRARAGRPVHGGGRLPDRRARGSGLAATTLFHLPRRAAFLLHAAGGLRRRAIGSAALRRGPTVSAAWRRAWTRFHELQLRLAAPRGAPGAGGRGPVRRSLQAS